MSTQLQLKSLQQGRGLAAMAVVAFHLSLLLGSSRYLNDAVFFKFYASREFRRRFLLRAFRLHYRFRTLQRYQSAETCS